MNKDALPAFAAQARELGRKDCRDVLQALLDAYAPKVNWSQPEKLHSAVRRAGELLGHIKKEVTP